MAYSDRAFGNWLPDEPEERVLETCACCGEDLLEGEEVVYDGINKYYCNLDCALQELPFEYVEENGYEAILCDGEYYQDLSDLQNEYFTTEILEG